MDSPAGNISILPIGVLLVVLTVIYLYLKPGGKKYKYPPGPKPWPIIGNLLEMQQDPALFRLFHDKWRKEYGEVFTIHAGPQPIVVLNSNDTYREALVTKQNDYAGRPRLVSMELLDAQYSIAFGDFDEVWKVQRKIGYAAIRKFASGDHLENLVHRSFDKVSKHFESLKEPIDPIATISLLVYNIIYGMLFGKDINADDPDFVKLRDLFDNLEGNFTNGIPADVFPILKYFPSKEITFLKNANIYLNDYLGKFIEEKRAEFDPDNVNDLVSMLVQIDNDSKQSGEGSLSHKHYIGICLDVFVGGTDTSRYTLNFLLLYTAMHPEVQKKLHEEVDRVLGKDGYPTIKDRPHLPYCLAVLHEVLRIRPNGPLALPHETTCDTTIGEYSIPKGTQVWPNVYSLHHDEKYWPNPSKFDPERWIDENGKFTSKPPGSEGSFMPFSAGRRVCIGEVLAKNELHLLVALFYQKFSVHAPEGTTLEADFTDSAFALLSKPFKLVVKQRDSQ